MDRRLEHLRDALAPPEAPDPLAARSAQQGPPRPDAPALASVAAILTSKLQLLLIQRATYPGDPWSGHVSFPGGRAEPSDGHTLQTAMRETHEELGIDLSDAEVLGALRDVPTAPDLPRLVVRPWVFWAPELPPPRPNYEVAAVLPVSLEALLAGHGRGTFTHTWRGQPIRLPEVRLNGGARLWGMTLGMVDDLLHRWRMAADRAG